MTRPTKASSDVRKIVCLRVLTVLLLLLAACGIGAAADWPAYRSDAARSGVTSETVGPALSLCWKYVPAHPPKPAWPMPAGELPRMHIDNAYPVVIAGGSAYFG